MKGRSRGDYVETYSDGEVIVREGDETREMYVVQTGSVVVTKLIAGNERTLGTMGRGSFFGEMALLESMPRHATVRAVGDTKVLVIKPGSLLLKIRRNPTFAFEMLQSMSRRLREANQRLMDVCQDGVAPTDSLDELEPSERTDHHKAELE